MQHIAIFGGTFDPVHNGHINISLAIQKQFHFDHYYFLPCNIPVLKPRATASTQQRIAMIQLALEPYPQLAIDLREINRHSPSYMVDTLTSFREEQPHDSLTLIMGYDSFTSLPQWHQWERIIHLANLLVINRSMAAHPPLPTSLTPLLLARQKHTISEFLSATSGNIFLFDAGDYDISSTRIRKNLQDNIDSAKQIPKKVFDYIKKNGIYS